MVWNHPIETTIKKAGFLEFEDVLSICVRFLQKANQSNTNTQSNLQWIAVG